MARLNEMRRHGKVLVPVAPFAASVISAASFIPALASGLVDPTFPYAATAARCCRRILA